VHPGSPPETVRAVPSERSRLDFLTNLWRGPRALALLARLDSRSKSLVRVLSHGELGDAAAFERRIEQLERRYSLVSAAQIVDASEGGRSLPPRALLLAFRRSEGFVERAWPSLRRRGLAAVLFVAPESAEGSLASRAAELRPLAEQGVTLGLSGGSPAGGARSAARLTRLLDELALVQPDSPRVYLYPEGLYPDRLHPGGRPSEEEIAAARAAGADLAFTALTGAIDLRRVDLLCLRTLQIDARASPEAFDARIVLASPRWSWLAREVEPATPEERRFEHGARARRRRMRGLQRPLDALLTAGARPRGFSSTLRALVRLRSSNYDRLQALAGLANAIAPPFGRALQGALLDTTRLPFVNARVAPEAQGSAATVFRLDLGAGRAPYALKVYRWTLGLPAELAHPIVRRQRARYALLREELGEYVLSTHFLLLHAPLCAWSAAASLQPFVERSSDLLLRSDEELLGLLRSRPPLAAEFVAFARRVLALRARGFFPDVLGPGNLLLEERSGGARIRLVDCDGLYDLRLRWPGSPVEALEASARRFERLLGTLEAEGCRTASDTP
jgi:hypothetical protein